MAKLIKIANTYYSDLRWRGRRVRRALSKDKREADRKLLEMVALRQAQKHGEIPKDVGWQFFKEKFLAWSKATKKHNTSYRDALSIRDLESCFPIQRLSQITPERLETVKIRLKERRNRKGRQKGHAAINREIKALKAMMRKAEEWKYIAPQSWLSVKVYREVKGRLVFFSHEELSKILQKAEGWKNTFVLLAGRCGLRLAECYWLEWKDIDFERNRVNIRPKAEWTPKDYECRFIPMTTDLKNHLKARSISHERFVFDHSRITLSSMSVMIRRLILSIGLTGSAHKLRHTYASHSVMAGVDLSTVQKLMGHESIRVTEKYSHLASSHLDDAARKLESCSGFSPHLASGGPFGASKENRDSDGNGVLASTRRR